MKFKYTALCLSLIMLAPSLLQAKVRGSASEGATGAASLNLGGGDRLPANFINVFKTATLSFNTPSDFLKLDDEGYLTSAPSGNVSISFPAAGTMWTGGVQYKMVWGAGLRFGTLTIGSVNTAGSCANTVNVTIGGCTGSSTTVTPTGTAGGSFTFTTSATQFSMFFGTSGTYSRSGGELALYRVSDETDYLAGEIFTPEFKSVLSTLNPLTIRPMGWVQAGAANLNGETTWAYRTKLTNFTWGGRYPTGIRCGSPNAISGTDTYSGPTAPDTPVTYTDGEQYQCVVTNSNTSSTVTLDVGGRGAKTVVAANGLNGPSAGAFTAGAISTFTYDAVLDKWLVSCDGVSSGCSTTLVTSVPIEAQIQLANRLKKNLWPVIPPWATDDYVTNWATVLRDNLDPSLKIYPEYSNEIWNFGFPQTQWALQRGLALGWASGSNVALYGWYGLRVRQIMGNLIPAVFTGQTSRLRRVMAYQAGGDTTNIGNRFNGSQLRSCTSFGAPCGNSVYDTLTGTANYTAFPNRPIDVTEVLAYAPYGGGTNLCTGADLNCTPAAANVPFYQALVTAWEGGNTATAISLIDDDIRTGRTLIQNVTASGTTFTTPLAHGFTTSTDVAFQVTGGTMYSGVAASTLYRVTGTSSAGCPGSVTCNFTMQPYVGGFPSGSNVNAGSAGSGTMTVGASGPKNLVNLSSTWYQFGESNAALYDSARSGGGLANLRVEQYEGNLEPKGPSAAQCTSLGITGSDCTGSIAAAITAWKNDTKARDTQIAYFKQFMGTDAAAPPTFGLMTHSRAPSQLVLPQGGPSCTGSQYALLSGCLPNSTPFQLYYGFQQFNFLLKRDMILDESGAYGRGYMNDNDPMWLEKAA